MDSATSKIPMKGGGDRLRKMYEEKRKKSKPSPVLLDILKQQKIEEEKNKNKKSDIEIDLGV